MLKYRLSMQNGSNAESKFLSVNCPFRLELMRKVNNEE